MGRGTNLLRGGIRGQWREDGKEGVEHGDEGGIDGYW